MFRTSAPALRPLLTLLLCALLLVQASTVLAMRSSMMPAAAQTAAGDLHSSHSPSCHDAPSAPSDTHSLPSGCDGDDLSGSYCQWACALMLFVVVPPDIVLVKPGSVALAAATAIEPRWRQSRIMRPPIG